ncbi:MAG: DUF2442 domain-containing protein [Bacteroides sp.]|nr:DUF2442 domain-containing protein [Bacteroides sp.]MCM1084825.1 DUF2442 domain-containing protein [Bacteroides sp.]
MEKINKLWFNRNRVWIETDNGACFSRPLEAFPVLKEASEQQRMDFKIGRFGDDVRWPSLDEDIHISSFTQDSAEPDGDNEIARIFAHFPQLNVSEIARNIGINKSLLSKYIYGIKKPGEKRKQEIIEALHELGRALMAV